MALCDGRTIEYDLRNQPDNALIYFTNADGDDIEIIHPGAPWPRPPITVSCPSQSELRERIRVAILATNGTYSELVERHRLAVLSGAEWEAWETVQQCMFLLGIFHPYESVDA
jgi:ABC-type phosphate/phosphonate transport system substrate-binding protein